MFNIFIGLLPASSDEELSTSDDEQHSDQIADASQGNPGWADSIAHVLSTNKPKTKKTLVLSKAKKITKVKTEKRPYDFEIDGEIKEEKPDPEAVNENIESKKRKNQALSLRVKPTIADRERERALKKIATKGVVQLFNAVRTQQKDIEDKLKEEKLDHRKDAVLNNINRRKFLDVLMSGERAKSELVDNAVKKEEIKSEDEDMDQTHESQWSALRFVEVFVSKIDCSVN